jgi:ATP-dependent Lhr-like helicase
MQADDLMAAVFPDAAACLENIPGDRQVPDHPLVSQTVRDCLEEAMDFEGLRAVLERIHAGALRLVARDTPEPSVFAHEILNARPYAFLDDAPLEERRSQAVQTRRGSEPSSAGELGALDPDAIARVREEERPEPRDLDELHDAILTAGFLATSDLDDVAPELLDALAGARRAGLITIGGPTGTRRIVAAVERLPELRAIHPDLDAPPALLPPASRIKPWTRQDALVEVLRSRVTVTGPVTAAALAGSLSLTPEETEGALQVLESDGVVLRGRFTRGEAALEWCDRALLARIHRYTLHRLRAEIEPVSPADFMRFLFRWQHVERSCRLTGIDGLREVIASLDGCELPAAAWERSVLPDRVDGYDPSMLDMICLAGEVGWARLSRSDAASSAEPALVPATPVALYLREHARAWRPPDGADRPAVEALIGEPSRRVLAALRSRGASFFRDLESACAFDAGQLRHALGILAACGLVTSDGFAGLRALDWASRGGPASHERRSHYAGRWTATALDLVATRDREDAVERQARALLRRYGVVFRRLLTREANAASWRELARVYRWLEARGEIRSGRFVSSMSGEQFALPDAVERLRETRRIPADGQVVAISAADPLNLTGVVTAGERIRSASRTRIAYRDGVPLGVVECGVIRPLGPMPPDAALQVSHALAVRRRPAFAR